MIPLTESAALSDAPLNKSNLLQLHLNDGSPCWHCDAAVVSKERPGEAEVSWHFEQTLPTFALSLELPYSVVPLHRGSQNPV